MRDLDGIGLLEQTKNKYPEMPVIMVTAVHDISVALAAIRNGAYDYLLKPFEQRDQLLNPIRRALENRRLKLELRDYQLDLESKVAMRTEQLQHAMGELEHVNEQLEKSRDVLLEALGDALDLKDAETEGHSKRVTAFTVEIARAMGIRDKRLRVIARGAFLHDIGKMAVPDSMLRKPGPLDPEEVKEVRRHCEHGYQLVRRIPFLSEEAEIVYAHQEQWDGSGYPRGLKGGEIPLGARIFSIADTLDAITSDRPYRPARSYEAARKEIIRCSGTQFDPAIVAVFLTVPEHRWEKLRDDLRRGLQSQVYKVPHAEPQLAGAGQD
jgi:putative nucleotidyltransferase with HDIG domain